MYPPEARRVPSSKVSETKLTSSVPICISMFAQRLTVCQTGLCKLTPVQKKLSIQRKLRANQSIKFGPEIPHRKQHTDRNVCWEDSNPRVRMPTRAKQEGGNRRTQTPIKKAVYFKLKEPMTSVIGRVIVSVSEEIVSAVLPRSQNKG